MGSQKIEPPNAGEVEWVRANAYTGDEQAALPDLALLDEIFESWLAEWLEQPESEREDPNPYINAIGMAFGQRLVDELGLEWAVVSDERGVEIAVHGQPGDILVFPPNLVAKRFETGETGFLAPTYEAIAQEIRHLRQG